MGRYLIHAKATAVILVFVFLSSAAWAGPATDQLRETLTQMVGVLKDPKLKAPDKEGERRAALHNV
ncbi:MAG: hypothetical protein V3S89_14585, partial [Desulfobacterales bacterium]